MKKFISILSSLILASLLASFGAANASIVYNLQDLQNTFGTGTAILGTVTLTQTDANEVNVLVNLAPSVFVETGSHSAFGFNLDTIQPSNPFGITIYTSGFSVSAQLNQPNMPYGPFEYSLICDICGNGGSNAYLNINTLNFSVYNASGINLTDFIANNLDFYFSADILYTYANGLRFTGVIGADSSNDHSVPEPASLALLSLGLIGFAVARRRRLPQTH